MNTPHDFDSSAFDDRVRSAFDADESGGDAAAPTPSLRVWQGLQPHLLPPVAPKSSMRPQVRSGLLGLVAGMLLMLGLAPKLTKAPETHKNRRSGAATTQKAIESPRKASATAWKVIESPRKAGATAWKVSESPRKVIESPRKVSETTQKVRATAWKVTDSTQKALATPRKVLATDTVKSVPTSAGLAATAGIPPVLLPLVHTEQTQAGFGTDSALTTRERRRDALLMQRAALVRLQLRTDSLLLTLGEPLMADVATVDSTPATPLQNRWSVALSFAPERNFFGLSAPAADTLSALRRTHEQGRAGWNAAVMAEYRLDRRWSVGAGVGLTSYGAELRLTDRQTDVTVTYDTQTAQATQTTHIENTTYSIREDSTVVLSPIFNLNYQIIGYDTVYMPRPDTIWTHLITDGTVVTNTITTKPTVTQRHEVSTRVLRPNYRFMTIPLLVRYRFGTERGVFGKAAASRWWTDVALGAQVQLFLGGTQLSSPDGRVWHTERVGPGGGPFRPLTVALTGALALNYALTPRLSASLSPTLRYQTESVYKAGTGLTQRPAATGIQMGLRLAF